MKKIMSFAVVILVAAFALVGCEQKDTSTPPPTGTNGASTNAP